MITCARLLIGFQVSRFSEVQAERGREGKKDGQRGEKLILEMYFAFSEVLPVRLPSSSPVGGWSYLLTLLIIDPFSVGEHLTQG